MVGYNTRLLKVCTPDGKRIEMHSFSTVDGKVVLTVKHNSYVHKDNPPFSKNGVILMTVLRKDYQEAVKKLTQYLEDLFLKGLEDEDMDTSSGINNDSRGDKEEYSAECTGVNIREGSDPSIHSSPRRKKHSKSNRGAEPDTEMVEGDYPSINSEDSTGY